MTDSQSGPRGEVQVMDGRVALRGAVTMDTVPGLLSSVFLAMSNGAAAVDLRAVEEVDSAAVALLLALRRKAGPAGEWRIEGAPPSLLNLARLYGVDALLMDAVDGALSTEGAGARAG